MAKRFGKSGLPYPGEKRRVVQHGELHDKVNKRWCKIHYRWIGEGKWDKHLMCDVVTSEKDKEKKPRGHALRKKSMFSLKATKKTKGKPKRTSSIVKYCIKHGKFEGYQWGGHRRTCQKTEISEAQWIAKVQARENRSLKSDQNELRKINEKVERERNAKLDFKDFSQREAFWKVMKRVGVTSGMFEERKVSPYAGSTVGFRVSSADPHFSLKVDDFITMFAGVRVEGPESMIKAFYGCPHNGKIRIAIFQEDNPQVQWVSASVSNEIANEMMTEVPMAESVTLRSSTPHALIPKLRGYSIGTRDDGFSVKSDSLIGFPIKDIRTACLKERKIPFYYIALLDGKPANDDDILKKGMVLEFCEPPYSSTPPVPQMKAITPVKSESTKSAKGLAKVCRVLGIKDAMFIPNFKCDDRRHKGELTYCSAILVKELHEGSPLKEGFPKGHGYVTEINNVSHFTEEEFCSEVISCMKDGGFSLNLKVQASGVETLRIQATIPSLEEAFEGDIFVPTDNVVFKVENHLKDLDARLSEQRALLEEGKKLLEVKSREQHEAVLKVAAANKAIFDLESKRKDFTSKVDRVLKLIPK